MKARHLKLVVGLLAVFTSFVVWPHSPASAASKAGDAKVIAPGGNASAPTPLDHGTTATPFSLQLPAAAACRGDSANESYRVQSYMVPASVDPATLEFGSVGPLPVGTGAKFREPLFDIDTNPYVNAQTAMATHPHGPGPIINIPSFNFAVLKAGDVPTGTYNIGIACTKGAASNSQLDTFWNVQIVVSVGPSRDDPVVWRTTAAASSSPGPIHAAAPVPANPAAGATPGGGAQGRSVSTPASPGLGDNLQASGGADHAGRVAPYGAPPSFGDPVRNFISVPGASALGVLVAAVIAFVILRLLVPLLRRPHGISLGRTMTTPNFATHQEDR